VEIALFGGSFDPPHVGHVLAATYALATEPVDELWMLPVFEHPFRKKLRASFELRARMCEAALAGLLPRARVSRAEAELGGEGRTVDLLEHLHGKHPEHRWVLVIGSDLVAETGQWKRFDRVQELARIVVVPRGGPLLPDLSSTEVRRILASGGDARALVPVAALRLALESGAYRAPPPEVR